MPAGRPPKSLDLLTFIEVWEKFEDFDDAYQEQVRLCKELGREPLSKASFATKASNLRARGYQLSLKKTGRKGVDPDVARMNAFIAEVKAGSRKEPELDNASVQAAIERLLKQYRAKRGA